MLRAHRGVAFMTGMFATVAFASVIAQESGQAEALDGLTAEELALEAPEEFPEEPAEPVIEPVAAADAPEVRIGPADGNDGYFDENGRYVIDLMEQDYTYITIEIETPDGRPVEGAEPVFSIEGTSRLLKPEEVSMPSTSNEYGVVEFAVVAGMMGLDQIGVEYGEASTEILVNVISLEATMYSMPEVGEGHLPWDDLMQARVRFGDMKLYADFPAAVTERAGEKVKISGFMMPLEAGMKQHRFLLTAHPPGCFFHTPGGPSGAVEVFSEEGIEYSWDPIIVEGEFAALEESEGAVYRLDDARVVEK